MTPTDPPPDIADIEARYLRTLRDICVQRDQGLIERWEPDLEHGTEHVSFRRAQGRFVAWALADVEFSLSPTGRFYRGLDHGRVREVRARWGIQDCGGAFRFRMGRVRGLGTVRDLLACAKGYADLALAMLDPENPDTYTFDPDYVVERGAAVRQLAEVRVPEE